MGPNQLKAGQAVPAWRKLLARFQDLSIYLLFVAVAISLVARVFEGTHRISYEAIVILTVARGRPEQPAPAVVAYADYW